jgi:hypothetical protein
MPDDEAEKPQKPEPQQDKPEKPPWRDPGKPMWRSREHTWRDPGKKGLGTRKPGDDGKTIRGKD